MNSKTPKFDQALDEYFSKLELDEKGGQFRTCRFSGEKFYVRPEDMQFYKKIRVPLPTLSPNERRRKRLANSNSYNLFKRKSDFSGNEIISTYPPLSPFKIYEFKIWFSDKWNPLDYGRDYDLSQRFGSQFHQLQLDVPRKSLSGDPSNINSDFTNVSKNLKNCYIVFDQNDGEDLYYHQCCRSDKNCVECWALDYCDTCYECKMGDRLFKCFYCEQCKNCLESSFLWDCRNCSNCFMSSNLRNKKYYFRNEYLGKEEYEKRMKDIYLGDYEKFRTFVNEFAELKKKAPRKPTWNEKSENVLGDYIKTSRNVYIGIYNEDCENIAYSEGAVGAKDSYDLTGSSNSQLCYELECTWEEDNYNSRFSGSIDNCREVEYCDTLSNSRNCFGCVGLSNKEFCIFNKQYSEEDYWKKIDEIKTKMLSDREYGEFFEPRYFIYPYKISWINSYPGFEDFENAEKYGYDMSSVEISSQAIEGETIATDELPNDIRDVRDDILNKIIYDTENNKQFRFIKQELDFYRKYGLPLPREHFAVRMEKWRRTFDVRMNFYSRKCAKCNADIVTTYAPNRPEIVYCEVCYLKEVV